MKALEAHSNYPWIFKVKLCYHSGMCKAYLNLFFVVVGICLLLHSADSYAEGYPAPPISTPGYPAPPQASPTATSPPAEPTASPTPSSDPLSIGFSFDAADNDGAASLAVWPVLLALGLFGFALLRRRQSHRYQ